MFKTFWHRRAAKKSLITSLEERRLNQNFKIKKVRVILDTSYDIERQFFNELAKTFGIPPVNISVFAFKENKTATTQYVDFFDPADIRYFGRFEGDLALMCEKEVDLQINYYNREDLYMSWVSSQAKKKLSVGFSNADQRLNDIVFEIDPIEKEVFQEELVKYLTVLKKL